MRFDPIEMDFTITSFQIDPEEKLRIPVLFNFFQEAAYIHAGRMGWSYDFLREKNLFWALSQFYLEIMEMPSWNETITVRSQPQTPDLFYAPRDFLVFNSRKEVIARAMSYWIIIDLDTRRPTPPETFFSGYEFPKETILFPHKREKIKKPENGELIKTHKTVYSDIDQNRHVNNGKYVEFLMNGYTPEFWKENKISSILINYSKEAVFNEELSLYGSREENTLNLSITGGDGYERILSRITLKS